MAQIADIAPSPSTSETQSAQPAAPARQSPSSFFRDRPYARILLIVVVVVLLVGGFFLWSYLASYEATDDAEVDGHSMPVSARIGGYVTKVNVQDNQLVNA